MFAPLGQLDDGKFDVILLSREHGRLCQITLFDKVPAPPRLKVGGRKRCYTAANTPKGSLHCPPPPSPVRVRFSLFLRFCAVLASSHPCALALVNRPRLPARLHALEVVVPNAFVCTTCSPASATCGLAWPCTTKSHLRLHHEYSASLTVIFFHFVYCYSSTAKPS